MAVPTSVKVQGSAIKITVATVLSAIPGIENIELDLGENKTYENADITSDYVTPVFAGLRGEGSLSADIIRDPTNAIQIALQIAFNGGTTLPATVILGAAGTSLTLSLLVTKLSLSGKKGEGFMGKVEFKLLTKVDWNAV